MAIHRVQHITNPNKKPNRREEKKIPGEYCRLRTMRQAEAAAMARINEPVMSKRAVENKIHHLPVGSGVTVFANGLAYYDVAPLQSIALTIDDKPEKIASAADEFVSIPSISNPIFAVGGKGGQQRWFMLAMPYVAAGRYKIGSINETGKVIQLRLDALTHGHAPIIMNTEGYLSCDLVCLAEIEFDEDGNFFAKDPNKLIFSDSSLSFFSEAPLSKSGMIISKDGKSYQNWREEARATMGGGAAEGFEPDL